MRGIVSFKGTVKEFRIFLQGLSVGLENKGTVKVND